MTILLFLFTQICFGQNNYFTFGYDSIYSEKTIKSRFESAVKRLPANYILKPTIYHKISSRDSIINYVIFNAIKSDLNSIQSKFEFVFIQDPLFLLLNKKLPEFTLMDLSGNIFSSSQLEGKPALINFWSIYCAPCIEEFSALNKLRNKYAETVNFIGIADGTCGKNDIQDLLQKHPFNFLILIDGDNYKNNVLSMKSVPHNIFIDKNGYIRDIQMGLPFEKDSKTGKRYIKSAQLFEKIIENKLNL